MTITAALIKQTPNELAYLLTHDGAAGDALVLDNATLAGDLIAGNLREQTNGLGVDTRENPNTQAIARRDMLGDGAGATDLSNLGHCRTRIQARDGIVTWAVDADVDGVSALRHELNIASSGGVAGNAILSIRFADSRTR